MDMSASIHDVHQHCFKLGYPKNKSLYDSFFKVFYALTGSVFKCNVFESPLGAGKGFGGGGSIIFKLDRYVGVSGQGIRRFLEDKRA